MTEYAIRFPLGVTLHASQKLIPGTISETDKCPAMEVFVVKCKSKKKEAQKCTILYAQS